jgi:hypothetical protein
VKVLALLFRIIFLGIACAVYLLHGFVIGPELQLARIVSLIAFRPCSSIFWTVPESHFALSRRRRKSQGE